MKVNVFEGARRITKLLASAWVLAVAVVTWADYSPAYHNLWTDIEDAARWAIAGVACMYVFSLAIGWIVRGFLGIPSGKDFRPQ